MISDLRFLLEVQTILPQTSPFLFAQMAVLRIFFQMFIVFGMYNCGTTTLAAELWFLYSRCCISQIWACTPLVNKILCIKKWRGGNGHWFWNWSCFYEEYLYSPKSTQLHILNTFVLLYSWQKSLKIALLFGRNNVFIKSFRFSLTFS